MDLLQTFAAQAAVAVENARLFQEIQEKGQQLELASQHKSQFLANMSHELRTPMNAVLGYTDLILDDIFGDVPAPIRETLERVKSNGQHLLGLINDVLDLSKMEAGQLTLSLGDYAMGEVVHTVVSAVESLAAGKKLAFKSIVPADLPPGRGDERRLTQVLLNLVGNAIKFTDQGQVSIEARAADGAFVDLGIGHRPRHLGGRSAERSSRSSSRPTAPALGRRAAAGSGSRSPGASSRCTAGASGWSPSLAKDPRSLSRCRCGWSGRWSTHEQARPGHRGPRGEPAHPARSCWRAAASRCSKRSPARTAWRWRSGSVPT